MVKESELSNEEWMRWYGDRIQARAYAKAEMRFFGIGEKEIESIMSGQDLTRKELLAGVSKNGCEHTFKWTQWLRALNDFPGDVDSSKEQQRYDEERQACGCISCRAVRELTRENES